MDHLPIPKEVEFIAAMIIGAAIAVHRCLGPGFLEKIYVEALCLELAARGIPFERECAVMVLYRGVPIPGQRIDLIVAGKVVVELKAQDRLHPSTEAKMISYLRTTGLRLGLVLNFNGPTLKEGIRRVVV